MEGGESEAQGGYSVLRLDEERVDVSAVARAVAPVVGRPRFEVARQLRATRGIVARGVSAESARRIVEGLSAMGIEAVALPEEDWTPLPPAERVFQLALGPNGLFLRLAEEDLLIPWEHLLAVVAARLGGTEARIISRATGAPRYYNFADTLDWETRRRTARHVVDFFPDDPWRRLRVEEGRIDFHLERDAARPSTAVQLEELGRQVRRWAGNAFLNTGAEILGEHGREMVWQDLTFGNEHLLDAYSEWVIQVAVLERRDDPAGEPAEEERQARETEG